MLNVILELQKLKLRCKYTYIFKTCIYFKSACEKKRLEGNLSVHALRQGEPWVTADQFLNLASPLDHRDSAGPPCSTVPHAPAAPHRIPGQSRKGRAHIGMKRTPMTEPGRSAASAQLELVRRPAPPRPAWPGALGTGPSIVGLGEPTGNSDAK